MSFPYLQKPRKQRPKLEKMKRVEKKKTKRETLQVISKYIYDMTTKPQGLILNCITYIAGIKSDNRFNVRRNDGYVIGC